MCKYNNNEIYHYGVIGMKWGIRRGNAAKSYAKGVKKLKKYEKKEDKFIKKSDKLAVKGTGITEISRARRQKSAEFGAKARGYRLKGKKFYRKMEKVFAEVPISKLNKQDLEYTKNYLKKYITN